MHRLASLRYFHDHGIMESTIAVAALAALAHHSRLAVFRALVEAGLDGAHPGELAAALGLAPATLSFQLKALAHAGLVEAEPNGRYINYRARFDTMSDLLAYLTENCCAGDPGACRPTPRGRGVAAKPPASSRAKRMKR